MDVRLYHLRSRLRRDGHLVAARLAGLALDSQVSDRARAGDRRRTRGGQPAGRQEPAFQMVSGETGGAGPEDMAALRHGSRGAGS